MEFKHIGIVGKPQAKTLTPHIINLARYLDRLGIVVYLDCGNGCDYSGFNGITGALSLYLDKVDLVIVIGGDGTLLAVGRVVADCSIPILGVNQGRLGFMTDIAINTMFEVLDTILVGCKYTIEERSLMQAVVKRNGVVVYNAIALNDIVISRGAIGNMIEFDISIDEQFVLSQKSDGVIFTTPTGSTAYALAAGGPILHPQSHVFSIVPICPQSLSNRPLVVSDLVTINFSLIKENATQIHFDGQQCFDLSCFDQVILTKYAKVLKIIHPQGYNYYDTLRRKLNWSKRVS